MKAILNITLFTLLLATGGAGAYAFAPRWSGGKAGPVRDKAPHVWCYQALGLCRGSSLLSCVGCRPFAHKPRAPGMQCNRTRRGCESEHRRFCGCGLLGSAGCDTGELEVDLGAASQVAESELGPLAPSRGRAACL